jgi:CRP/FNR family cyclic AMP-dependent transcriptional regulator
MTSPNPPWQEDRLLPSARTPARAKEAEALKRLDFCRHFDLALLQRVAPRFTFHAYARRAALYQAGEERDAVYGIVQGHVKIFQVDPRTRRRALLDVLVPGTLCGEDAIYSSGPRDRTAIAYDAVTALRITASEFRHLAKEHPSLYDYLLYLLGERLQRAESKVRDLALDGIARRLAKLLVELAARYGTSLETGGVLINLKLPHRELADLVGSTRESVTMHLNDLRRQRLIEITDRRILITDPDSLSAQA